jgi:hypothetical protein
MTVAHPPVEEPSPAQPWGSWTSRASTLPVRLDRVGRRRVRRKEPRTREEQTVVLQQALRMQGVQTPVRRALRTLGEQPPALRPALRTPAVQIRPAAARVRHRQGAEVPAARQASAGCRSRVAPIAGRQSQPSSDRRENPSVRASPGRVLSCGQHRSYQRQIAPPEADRFSEAWRARRSLRRSRSKFAPAGDRVAGRAH